MLLVAACGEDELILEGVREPVRLNTIDEIPVNRVEPVALPPQQLNTDWTHQGGSPTHLIGHPVLRQPMSLTWSTPIGAGEATEADASDIAKVLMAYEIAFRELGDMAGDEDDD